MFAFVFLSVFEVVHADIQHGIKRIPKNANKHAVRAAPITSYKEASVELSHHKTNAANSAERQTAVINILPQIIFFTFLINLL